MCKFLSNADIIKGVIAVLIGVFVLTSFGCGSGSSLDPFAQSCERNDTADVRFSNLSATGITMEVIWDGSLILTLAPGETSGYYTQNAGGHSSLFRNAATHQTACNPANPNLAECTVHTFSCSK